MAPVMVAVAAIAIGGLLFAMYANKNKEPASDADSQTRAPVVDPFAGVKDEVGPTRMSPGGRKTGAVDRSPSGLLQDAVWIESCAKANEGYLLAAAAETARRAKDDGAFRQNAVNAKELFNKLFEDTYYWEEDLVEKYGDNDRRVKQIMTERSKWLDTAHRYNTIKRE